MLDIFETPVTVTPQQEISKPLNSSKILSKYLTFTFRERAFTFRERAFTLGERAFTFRERAFTFGEIGVFGVFGISFFVAGGFWGSVGRGAP